MRAKGFVQVARRQSTSQSRDHRGNGVTGVVALFRASTLRTRFARTASAAATSGGFSTRCVLVVVAPVLTATASAGAAGVGVGGVGVDGGVDGLVLTAR